MDLSSPERGQGEGGDIEESLQKSYLLMKTKLDELEQYNKTLESQLGSIFSSISRTVKKAESGVNEAGGLADRGEADMSKEESQSNWKSVSPGFKSDEDVEPCQVLDQTQQLKNSISHIKENRQETASNKENYQNKRKNVDLSETIRELRLSDIGDLKRALLLKKTQRSFSLSSSVAGENPYIERSTATRNENVPIKFQQHHISPARSDLNNNNTRSNDAEHNQSKGSGNLERKTAGVGLGSLPPPYPTLDGIEKQVGKISATIRAAGNQRFVNSKKYFTPTRTIKTERSKSTGDNPLHYQFYPNTEVNKYREAWTNSEHSNESSKSRVFTLENILENDDHHYEAIDQHRDGGFLHGGSRCHGLHGISQEEDPSRVFPPLESPSYRTLADIKTCKSRKYSSKTQSIDGFSPTARKNSLIRVQTSHQNFNAESSDSEQRLTSSSSLSPQSLSSFSSIYASTLDYSTTEDDSVDSDLVDEFFLFPYDVLDADFEDICQELARYSTDPGNGRQRGHLKAAKASDEWNTLWIYRGV